jgi:hypothetical protein
MRGNIVRRRSLPTIRRRHGPERIVVTVRRRTSGGLVRVVHGNSAGEVETQLGGLQANRDETFQDTR